MSMLAPVCFIMLYTVAVWHVVNMLRPFCFRFGFVTTIITIILFCISMPVPVCFIMLNTVAVWHVLNMSRPFCFRFGSDTRQIQEFELCIRDLYNGVAHLSWGNALPINLASLLQYKHGKKSMIIENLCALAFDYVTATKSLKVDMHCILCCLHVTRCT